MKTAKHIESELAQFGGTERWYKILGGHLVTDEVKYLADECKAWWLTDIIASYQSQPKFLQEDFQVWELFVHEGASATIVCTDGNKNELAMQDIEYTDLPLKTIRLYAVRNEEDHVTIMLPGEY